jgi:alpha-L-fucosidase
MNLADNKRTAAGARGALTMAALLLCLFSSAWTAAEDKIANALKKIDAGVAAGPFRPTWESLEKFQVPEWYQDAKFGIFIHWGVYSVPAFGDEWYPRRMYEEGREVFQHHIATYGPQSKFGYKDFIPQFKAEKFDAARWADLFRKAGAKYVVPVAEHHDGFPMYDCSFTEWSAAKMGPKTDVLGELASAIRKEGLHFCASTHRAEHWWFYDVGMLFDSDVADLRYEGLYGPARPQKSQPDKAYLDDWLARTCEIVDKYRPDLIWFDWWIEQPVFQPYLQKFAAFYYNRGAQWKRGVAINYKNKSFPEKAAVWDIERGKLDILRPYFWQTDTSICKRSWGYIQNHDYRSVDSIVDDLVDIVSKNGALLLNIGPRPDGTIPEPQEKILLDIGQWLKVNGEAIYGTRPWKIFGEGPTQVVGGSFKDTANKPFTGEDIRFTTKGDTIYAIALAWPEGGRLTVISLASGAKYAPGKIQAVDLLGSGAQLKWSQGASGLTVELPAPKPCDYAFAFRIRTK